MAIVDLMSFGYLRKSEIVTRERTRQEIAGIHQHVPTAIDTLFKIPYFHGVTTKRKTERWAVQSFVLDSYVTASYSFAALYTLYETGYYLEASFILRHLFELLVQMRFYHKKPRKGKKHILNKERIRFSTILENVAPKSHDILYKTHYGDLLSGMVHGRLVKSVFRIERPAPDQQRAVMGNEYHEGHASFIYNQMVALLCGYLNRFKNFFPENTITSNRAVQGQLDSSVTWLKSCMAAHRAAKKESREWHKHMKKIVG